MVTRAADDIVAAVFSRSGSAPHLFGDTQAGVETESRRLLRGAGPNGTFGERMRGIAVGFW